MPDGSVDLWARLVELADRGLVHAGNTLIGAFGGVVAYLYTYHRRGTDFSWSRLIIMAVVAGGVGTAVAGLVPEDAAARDTFIWVGGFLSFPLLDQVSKQAKRVIDKVLSGGGGL